jgi:hypothetical protein
LSTTTTTERLRLEPLRPEHAGGATDALVGRFTGQGLVEGRTGVHDGAPFALYVAVPG